jgi:hypothetical protein
MKSIAYLLVFCSLSTVATCQSPHTVSRIEFSTLTRGFQKQLFLKPDSLIEIVDGRQEANKVVKRSLNQADWERLVKSLDGIRLEEIPSLQSPTTRRAFDGARHSTIKITIQDGKEFEHTFDDENPHPKLKDLMEAILKVQTGSPQR